MLGLRVNYLLNEKSKEGNGSIIRPHSQGNCQNEDIHLTALPKKVTISAHICEEVPKVLQFIWQLAWAKRLLFGSSITKW